MIACRVRSAFVVLFPLFAGGAFHCACGASLSAFAFGGGFDAGDGTNSQQYVTAVSGSANAGAGASHSSDDTAVAGAFSLANAAYGFLSGDIVITYVGPLEAFGVGHVGAGGSATASFFDRIHIPAGRDYHYRTTLRLSATYFTTPGINCCTAQASASGAIGGVPFNLSPGNLISFDMTLPGGSVIDVGAGLAMTLSTFGGNGALLTLTPDDAGMAHLTSLNSFHLSFDPLSSDGAYTTDSGSSYVTSATIPEPSTGVLAALGAATGLLIGVRSRLS